MAKVSVENISKKVHPTEDAYNAFSPLFLFSSVLGLRKIKSEDNKITTVAPLEKIYTVIFAVFLLLLYSYAQQVRFLHISAKTGFYPALIDMFGTASLFTLSFFSIVISFFFSGDWFKKFFENVDVIDGLLRTDTGSVYSKFRKKTNLFTCVYLLSVTFQFIYSVYFSFHQFYVYVLWYVLIVIMEVTNSEYMACVYLLSMKIEEVNRRLEINERDDEPTERDMSLFCEEFKCAKVSDVKKFFDAEQKNRQIFNEDIFRVMKVYDKVADNAHILNNAYGMPILLTALTAFVNVLIGANTIISMHQKQDFGIDGHIRIFTWMFHCILPIVVGTFITENFLSECCKMSTNIHKRTLQKNIDAYQQKLLERFSLLISSRKIQMTACNFFDYNLSFLTCIVSALVSYIIILMQAGKSIRLSGDIY